MPVAAGAADWRGFLPLDALRRHLGGALPARLGIAVSGGGDSMALLRLTHAAADSAGWQVRAVTVDHGLRPEAAAEAAFVAQACARLGIPHDILTWRDRPSGGNLMDQARRARRRLIGGWARENGIFHVAMAHTADDQAETLVMRLARQSGLDGLSAMRAVWTEQGIVWLRPLLEQSRAGLRDYLRASGQHWVEDPTNQDPAFERARIRQAMPALAAIGLTPDVLARTSRHLAAARTALDALLRDRAAAFLSFRGGDVLFDRAALMAQDSEVQRLLMLRALRWVASAPYPPVMAKWLELRRSMDAGRAHTLGGCVIRPAGNSVAVGRELAAVADLRGPTTDIWDGRWQIDGPHAPGLHVGALGPGIIACPRWRETGLPRATLMTSPAIWRGATLVAAPVAGLENGWTARIATDFWNDPVSH